MNVKCIKHEVTELTNLSYGLRNSENQSDIESNMLRLYYKMNELLSESEYAEAAEEIIQNIELYQENQLTKSEVINKVTELIEKMQGDLREQEKLSNSKSMYEQIRAYEPKKGEENNMSKNNVTEIINQLNTIRATLGVTEDFQEIEMCIRRLIEIVIAMKDLDTAKMLRSHITLYYMNKMDMEVLLESLDDFIEEVMEISGDEENAGESTIAAVCKEVKNVCGSIWNVVQKETGAACKEIGRTLREETPNCANTINYVKETPKRAERAIKDSLRKWLFSDDDSK